jgi:hypothetical protein
MNTRTGFIALALVAGGALAAQALTAQTPDTKKPSPDMKKWEEFASPSEGHAVLNDRVGKWNLKVKMIMDPSAPAEESTGTNDIKWIMDGRYLEDRTEGTANGKPFHGLGHSGYDNLKKKYVGTWIDNMGTGIGTYEGTYDAATKTFTYTSDMPDPMQGKYVKTRTTEKIVDKDHWIMSTFSPGKDGKEFMCMEIDYTRAK